jgi:hypothetical protein
MWVVTKQTSRHAPDGNNQYGHRRKGLNSHSKVKAIKSVPDCPSARLNAPHKTFTPTRWNVFLSKYKFSDGAKLWEDLANLMFYVYKSVAVVIMYINIK